MTKTLSQDDFKGAPEWANFLVVNAYGIGFFTDASAAARRILQHGERLTGGCSQAIAKV